ncbi:hypothetical protein B0H19DRAFT_1073704 [Mycena capillaripes]|nr:hypothetical protein B0H19DRAFT_1073704 [Mycena capillaripes]
MAGGMRRWELRDVFAMVWTSGLASVVYAAVSVESAMMGYSHNQPEGWYKRFAAAAASFSFRFAAFLVCAALAYCSRRASSNRFNKSITSCQWRAAKNSGPR